MDSDKTVIATFTEIPEYTLSISIVGNGAVSYSGSSPYQEGEIVTLTATPSTGYEFSGWSGDLSGSVNPEQLIMDSDKTVIAIFTDQEKSSILVEKKIDWGIDSQYMNHPVFDFYATKTGGGTIDTFSLGDNEIKILTDLEPGEYQIVEDLMGWGTAEIHIKGGSYNHKVDGNTGAVEIEAGEMIVITFINRPPDFKIPEIPFGTLITLLVMMTGYAISRKKPIL
jgi:hypothetical protein